MMETPPRDRHWIAGKLAGRFAGLLALVLVAQAVPSAVALSPSYECSPFVFFDKRSASLSAQAKETLYAFMVKCPVYHRTIVVQGHSDIAEEAASQMTISRARAEAVRSHLLSIGIPAKTIKVEAYGHTRPLVPSKEPNEIVDAQNRRVLVTIEAERQP